MNKLDPMMGTTRTPNGTAGTLLPLSKVNRNENLNKIDMSLDDIKSIQRKKAKQNFPTLNRIFQQSGARMRVPWGVQQNFGFGTNSLSHKSVIIIIMPKKNIKRTFLRI